MSEPKTVIPTVIMDGNEAAASVAYRLSEVVAIYPITPSSPMAEWADQWRSEGKKNIWGALPIVEEMQSEGGAAGALHGALQAGAFGTTFTASQGLLLMIPNMFKIAGELTPATMHVTARTLATHALSIFGDHSDVMACRSTGWAMLASNSVQEVADLALVAQIATLESRIPFIHFFDGFRTSHEVGKILPISDETIRAMVDDKYLIAFRKNALTPDRPFIRGTAQNPDVFFQAREACTPFHAAVPGHRAIGHGPFCRADRPRYRLFDYYGAPDAERVIVIMGSGAEAAEEAVDALMRQGEKVGMLKVRLYRPFDSKAFLAALPATVKSIAVLDRCKEPGGAGEPLYQDIVTVLAENAAKLPFAAMPDCHRRPLRPLVEGIHAGDGQGRLRRADQARAQESLHHRHQRRREPHQPRLRSGVLHRRSEDRARALLRPGFRRHRGRQQELHQDHRQRDAELRAGLLRLRLQEVRLDDHLAPAVRAQPDPVNLSDYPRQLRGLPQLQLPREDERAGSGDAGRGLPAQLALLRRPRCGTSCPRPRRKRCCARRSSST